MTWATQKPTKPGWYWWQNEEQDPSMRLVEYVLGRLCIDGLPIKQFPGRWSSEPIPEPEEQP